VHDDDRDAEIRPEDRFTPRHCGEGGCEVTRIGELRLPTRPEGEARAEEHVEDESVVHVVARLERVDVQAKRLRRLGRSVCDHVADVEPAHRVDR
jgi:hypothetical protein